MSSFNRFARRMGLAATVAILAATAATVTSKPAAADNDDWGHRHHQRWKGDRGYWRGGVYVYAPPPVYYAPPPPVYYAPPPPPVYYAPAPVYPAPGLSLGITLPLR
ncbi:MAG: hypothetical protein QOK29_4867 [Rhodospirillaceae bacterium]|jgi:hypothetical protein|nr:hypothetical protein [Rhodospirillaceae bacterium]